MNFFFSNTFDINDFTLSVYYVYKDSLKDDR